MNRLRKSALLLCFAICLAGFACSSNNAGNGGGDGGGDGGGGGGGGGAGSGEPLPQVVFTPVGSTAVAGDLIDVDFLPGQNGESIAVGLGGDVYYLRNDFTALSQVPHIDVDDGNEQGLLGVVAHPDYANNHFIYIYFTVPGQTPDINQVDRLTVNVNVAGNTFSLSDRQTIISFDKQEAEDIVGLPSSGENHNGGSMVFMDQTHLAIGVGDSGGSAGQASEISQSLDHNLGKIHRIIPSVTPSSGGFTAPDNDIPGATVDSIYALGLRNPFTLILDDDGDLFVGDVGAGSFEEINCIYVSGENYVWPLCEGPISNCEAQKCPLANAFDCRFPIHSYSHGDDTFENEDPEDNSSGGRSIMLQNFYQGQGYGGAFFHKVIYSEFFGGWVRALTLNETTEQKMDDQHIGHLEGLTGLHQHPVDGLLYGTSLGGADRLVRMDLAP